jgi:hypothetical protein
MTLTPRDGFPRAKLGEDERLRNAAPELLEALKDVGEWLDGDWLNDPPKETIRAAIAKAEGKP